MFLLTADERQELIRGLLPRARRHDVPDELRGWNWGNPPIATTSDILLGAWEIVSAHCDTSRDIFLRRVEQMPFPASAAMRRGRCIHGVAVDLVTRVKKMIYADGIACLLDIERTLAEPPDETLNRWVGAEESSVLRVEAAAVWRYLHRGIVVALQEALSAQPRHSADSLIAAALPLVMEWKIDGHRIGLSSHLSVDAFVLGAPILLQMRAGEPDAGHRLQLAAYAMAAESVYEVPFDLGAISYLVLDGPHVRIAKHLFIIDDTLREDALDARDTKIAILEQSLEPPVSDRCPRDCPYLEYCHGAARIQQPALRDRVPGMPPMLGSHDLEAVVTASSQTEGRAPQ